MAGSPPCSAFLPRSLTLLQCGASGLIIIIHFFLVAVSEHSTLGYVDPFSMGVWAAQASATQPDIIGAGLFLMLSFLQHACLPLAFSVLQSFLELECGTGF